jgi:hypothetical protein
LRCFLRSHPFSGGGAVLRGFVGDEDLEKPMTEEVEGGKGEEEGDEELEAIFC